jgi:hypothetical protein
MLTSQGAASPSQDQLAHEMGSSENAGTMMVNAVNPLNRYRNTAWPHTEWVYDEVSSARGLLDVAVSEAWDFRQDAMIGIDMRTIDYYPQNQPTSYHAVVLYGYDTAGGGSVYVFDPYDGARFGRPAERSRYGKHKVPLATAWRSMSGSGAGVVW